MNQVVLGVIVVNVLISLKGFNDISFLDTYKFRVGSIQNGEKIRMFTSGFLHVDWMHLLFNMYALYIFGDIVVNLLGVIGFLFVYIMGLLAGNMYSLWYHKSTPYYSAVGASGAVSAILYSAILLYPTMTLMLFPLPIPIPAYVFGVGYLLYSIYGMKQQLGNIGHSAHLGGAIAGFVGTLLLFPSLLFQHFLMVGLLALPILLILLFGSKLQK